MASFLVRGGATTAKKSPPFAIDDPTAPMHGDFTGKHGAAAAGAERPPAPRLIRGYAGFVPNIKEVAGASYSKCADRALTTEVVELLSSDSLPADPQSAVHSAGTRAKPNEVTAAMTATKHIPGYTGHVTGVKHAPIGVSFSAYTGEVLTGGAPGSGVFDTDGSRRAMNRTLINTPQAASVKHLKPKLSVSDPALRGVRYTSSQL
ncbi:hypothetical protein FNF27_04166 [Cafeteria roenbergensis]|uniref:Uncharacterized protein n=1 Tax=Cafeteria roenbergensis TaxID=33653 RepID=A0A5A8CGH2_CAFRO|nr:hypothetical protein FNF29_04705 [Cafeteria roenbergensis]KAA0174373.1 hypothetical protein FNF27_04166 [Cafeteria roenbergensis]|eukprot:KAA0151230.1 hypothetical protein FNF29_04705 [Cafeteria roenbergensis]